MDEKKMHELTVINRRTFYPRQNGNMAVTSIYATNIQTEIWTPPKQGMQNKALIIINKCAVQDGSPEVHQSSGWILQYHIKEYALSRKLKESATRKVTGPLIFPFFPWGSTQGPRSSDGHLVQYSRADPPPHCCSPFLQGKHDSNLNQRR